MYTVAKHGGFLAVIGESGSGKTTLFNDLYERIETDRAKVIVATPSVVDIDLNSNKTRLTARRLLESILSSISSEHPRQSMQRLTEQVKTALAQTTASESGHSVVLMVEEAHSLMPATLKTMKRLLELKAGHRYLLGVILIGQPELSDLLDESRHPELREVIRRCEVATLMPLDAHLEQYIMHKLMRRNIDPPRIFAPDAFEAIRIRLTQRHGRAVASQLYPLMVNNLLVKAMNQTARIGEDLVTAEVIQSL
jgi:type II secretory pathway predicted ATPase ExeA